MEMITCIIGLLAIAAMVYLFYVLLAGGDSR